MLRQYELVEIVKAYDADVDEDRLNRAYVFAMQKHGSQKRASGDPYFSHPIEVAGLLTRYRLDADTIITGLLHDTIEDTDATPEEIIRLFGDQVYKLVDGVTKLSQLEHKTEHNKQAENLRKLLLAMSEDIRVLLVKLADRLHNMRTLHFIKKPEKRMRIASETLELYAPLAERIGMKDIKEELEDLAFGFVNPDARDVILERLAYFCDAQGSDAVDAIISDLTSTLAAGGLAGVEVVGRRKQPYSIWRKMQRKNISFGELSDIIAFRVLTQTNADCYQALGLIHGAYKVVPDRFKDFISTPKRNGYRSIHTTVFGPNANRIEVQIRTEQMHHVNEQGVAAHWAYKQGRKSTSGRQYPWVRELLDILEQTSEPEEFLEHTKLAMFPDQVFCFTPTGEVISLPAKATPVDFAYQIHTDIGDTCAGAKVNGRMVPLKTRLNNGDQVEIMVSKAHKPNPNWERFVVSARAKARIRRYVKQQELDQHLALGRAMLQKACRANNLDYTEKALAPALKAFSQDTVQDLIVLVAKGNIAVKDVISEVYPRTPSGDKGQKVVPIDQARRKKQETGGAIPIKGLIDGLALHFARCCHPLPGERIVGIVTTGKGVTIHTIDCHTLETFSDQPERWLDVSWEREHTKQEFVGRLDMTIAHEPGALSTLTTVIAKNKGNITNLRIGARTADFFEMIIDVAVGDVKHLTNIIAALRAIPAVNNVERARG